MTSGVSSKRLHRHKDKWVKRRAKNLTLTQSQHSKEVLVPRAGGWEASNCYLASKLQPRAESLSWLDEVGSPL